jgi:muramoyltetrapeptide carboxypeptidase
MTRPPFLQKGDTIGILSTARKTNPEAIGIATRIMEAKGYRVKYAPNLFAEEHQFAGADPLRIADMHTLLQDPALKAILCARGGYGSTRIIDQIDWSLLDKQPKWICGFSDVTAILCHLHNRGLESLHCSMAALFDPAHPERVISTDSIFSLLSGEPFTLQAAAHPFNRSGKAEGELIGGNLSILNNLIGTASDPDYSGKILFMEDLDEYLYHIDRMMVHLKRCGKLEKLAGLVVGQMSDMNDNPIPFGKSAYEIIEEHVAEYTFPLAFGFPIGHEALNMAVPHGRRLQLAVAESGSNLWEK